MYVSCPPTPPHPSLATGVGKKRLLSVNFCTGILKQTFTNHTSFSREFGVMVWQCFIFLSPLSLPPPPLETQHCVKSQLKGTMIYRYSGAARPFAARTVLQTSFSNTSSSHSISFFPPLYALVFNFEGKHFLTIHIQHITSFPWQGKRHMGSLPSGRRQTSDTEMVSIDNHDFTVINFCHCWPCQTACLAKRLQLLFPRQ